MNYHDNASALIRSGTAGTPSQRERLASRLLSDDELHEAVRDLLFSPVAETQRWIRVDKDLVKQRALSKGEAGHNDQVVIETVPADALDASEWEKRATIIRQLESWYSEKQLNVSLTVNDFWLVISCGTHQRKRTKLRVVARWCEVDHVREIAL